MSSESPVGGDSRLSFAKIAAMSAPSKPDISIGPVEAPLSSETQDSKDSLHIQNSSKSSQRDKPNPVERDVDVLSQAVRDAHLTDKKTRESPEISGDAQENGNLKREISFEDDRTHLSNSSTKPTSFDSKSMASVATFAMDEKDSLRPDDSASVQAIDEEESLSGIPSGAPNSLTGSESGARGFKDPSIQKSKAILQNASSVFHDGGQRSNGTAPDFVSSNYILPNPEAFQSGRALHGFPQDPDEKLLEAMKSPKDRLLILQLEDKVRYFIQHSKEQSLELPPSNAFGRLLAHKLGDYYHLTHFVDNNVTSVRLHRTPFCRLPTPLSALESAITTPPPPVPAMKIMRRTDGERPTDGSNAASSIPSKTGSEAGDSGNERGGGSGKDRLTLTREEREAKYQEVRERIFRDFPDSKSSENPSGDQSVDMSRSSSTSGRKKAQRQKTPHDDSFEARSQFNTYYPGFHYAQGPTPYSAAMNDSSFSNPQQPPYVVGPGVAPPGVGYPHNGQNDTIYSGQMPMNSMPQYPMPVSPQMSANAPWQGGNLPQQSPFPGYASMNQSPAMMSQQPATKSSPAMNNYAVPYQHTHPNWSSPPFQGSFQQPSYRNQPPVHWPNYPSQPMASTPASYPYAQYPGQPLNAGMGMQNPYPSTFARSPFNPQTRSFVPGGGPVSRHPSKTNPSGMSPYPTLYPGVQPQWTGYPDTGRGLEGLNAVRGPPLGGRDSIAKWGTPSHLPPKPPPSEVSYDLNLKPRNADLQAAHTQPGLKNGPLVVSGGASVPKSS